MAIILLAITLCIFYLNNNLKEFIDICILGISEFRINKSLSVITLGKNIILIGLSIIIAIILRKNKIMKTTNIGILICFAIGANFVILPLVNEYHAIIANILWNMIILYEIYPIIEKATTIKQINVGLKITSFILVIIITITSFNKMYIKQNEIKIKNRNDVFFGAIIEEEQKNEIEAIELYIQNQIAQGKDIKILSTDAMLYSLNLKLDNWYFDLPLKGNMGRNGEQKLIEKMHTFKNTILLIEDRDDTHYQFMDNVRKYVENNYERIDEIKGYNVYAIN